MSELNPIRGSQYPIGVTYRSPRLDEYMLLEQNSSWHRKQARVKHLNRNNFLAGALVKTMKTFVAGNGLKPVRLDPLRATIWNGWVKRADMAQTKSYDAVLHDIVDAMCAGDCLVVLRARSVIVENRVNSFVDVVNSGRVATPSSFLDGINPANKHKVVLGVEQDTDGVEVGYWVVQDPKMPLDEKNFVFVPRYNPKTGRFISALIRNPSTAPNSVRGSAPIDSVIPEVEDCASLCDSGVQSGIVKNSLSVGITTPIAQSLYSALDATDETGAFKTDLDPSTQEFAITGKIPYGSVFNAPPGSEIKTISHSGNVDLIALIEQVKHNFSAGVGVPYEILFGNYAGVNFSAGKLLHDPFWRLIDQWVMCLVDLTQQIYEAVTDEGLLVRGISPISIPRAVGSWMGSPKTEADESKSMTTAVGKISGGLMAPSTYHAERGSDYRELLLRYKECIDLEMEVFGESFTLASLKSSPQNKHVIFASESTNDPDAT